MIDKEAIAKFNFFKGLTYEDIDDIISISSESTFEPNNLLLQETGKGTDIYVILEGRASVSMKTPNADGIRGDKTILCTFRKGDIFGELAFLKGVRRAANVVAIDTISAMIIDGCKLMELCEKKYQIGYFIMKNIAVVLAERLADLNFKLRDNIY